MIDRDTLAREMLEAWKIDKGLPCEKAADIAMRHIAAARTEALEEVKADTQARYIAELMMRDAARKNKNASIAEMHSDRAQAFNEIIRTLAQFATDGGNHDRS
jgi:hypothetical protein